MWENSKLCLCNEEGVGLQQNSRLTPSAPWWTCHIHFFFSLHSFSQNRGAPFWNKSGLGCMPACFSRLTCKNSWASSRVKRFLRTAGDGLSHRRLTQELQVWHQDGAHLIPPPHHHHPLLEIFYFLEKNGLITDFSTFGQIIDEKRRNILNLKD